MGSRTTSLLLLQISPRFSDNCVLVWHRRGIGMNLDNDQTENNSLKSARRGVKLMMINYPIMGE